MSSPVVSVIVPTYNRQALLPRALDSVVAQTFDNWEIVLVDDGSTDGTEDVAARYREQLKERFTYIRQPNQGSSNARNHGMDACNGRFVAFLDSDDEFLPTKEITDYEYVQPSVSLLSDAVLPEAQQALAQQHTIAL